MSNNPYEAPNFDADARTEPVPAEIVKRRLSRPATALIIMASCHSVLESIRLVSMVVFILRGTWGGLVYASLAFLILRVACLIFISIGAAQMAFLKSYRLGQIAAILACVPFLTPFVILGIPFGIWSLVLLGDPAVKAAFDVSTRNSKVDDQTNGR